MKSWRNGDNGATVKEIIDNNFDILESRINQSTKTYVKYFSQSDWISGTIFINYSEYNKLNPCVELYINDEDGYSIVYGGYVINDNGIKLQSDIAYKGKVVVR